MKAASTILGDWLLVSLVELQTLLEPKPTMTNERIFNIFIYFDEGIARDYGMCHHRQIGSDEKKSNFLRSAVDTDFLRARHFSLPRPLSSENWHAMQRQGVDLALFEEGFARYHATRSPIICITAIVDGAPKIDLSSPFEPLRGAAVGGELPGEMQDWLIKYTDGDEFHFDRLINDDYFTAIRLLFNQRHIASASKLLMSCIDTLAYVEFGDETGNFTNWLDEYTELDSLGVTSRELWEFRNSVVHMTNLSSRAVKAGKGSTIVPYIGSDLLAKHTRSRDFKPFNLHGLILVVGAGIGRWAASYNANREKFAIFIERYDTIISDSRLAEFSVGAE